jgi:hypothetical protein
MALFSRLKNNSILFIIKMASLAQDIYNVRSIRDSVRKSTLSGNAIRCIDAIQKMLGNTNGVASRWRQGNHSATAVKSSSGTTSSYNKYGRNYQHNKTAQPVDVAQKERVVPQKYVSKFKKNSDDVNDTILNTILLGKLNKFSKSNYNEIKEFITHIIDNGQTDMIKCFMKLVFEKAASEEIFCPLYAQLLSELSSCYPILLDEMQQLYEQYMSIFEEVADGHDENYNELCARHTVKKYRRGYSQFLSELIKHEIIDADTFIKIIVKIIDQLECNVKQIELIKVNEEFADCLMKMLCAIKHPTVDNPYLDCIEQTVKDTVVHRIQPLTVRNPMHTGLSNKARFALLNIYEELCR